MNNLENEVICFFNKKWTDQKLTKDSFVTDYYKNEDDAFYIFLEFFEVFKIERGYLDLDKYFCPGPNFLDLIRFKKVKQENKPKISIEHLVRVAEKKEWFDPE